MTTEEKAKAYDMALESARKELGVDRKEWEVVQRVLHNIFPELAESEDERIRKVIRQLMLGMREEIFTSQDEIVTKEKVLAWLEKQKEQKPTEEEILSKLPDYTPTNLSPYIEQKPVQNEEEREYVKTLKGLVSDFVRDRGGSITDVGYYQCICDWLDGRHIEQKPIEWSEEDEKMKERLITRLNWITYNTRTDGTSPNITFFEEIDWLKSLRPSWKPSEQEKGALRTAIHVLTEERNFPKTAEQLQAILDAFDGKESRKDWKPSEEQMKALESAVKLYKDTHYEMYHERIVSLYEQLKKLM